MTVQRIHLVSLTLFLLICLMISLTLQFMKRDFAAVRPAIEKEAFATAVEGSDKAR